MFVLEEDIQLIIQHWIRILNIKVGWILEFDKIVVKYVTFLVFHSIMANKYYLSQFNYPINIQVLCGVRFSPYHYHYNRHVICSASYDKTICFWDIRNNQQLQIYKGHRSYVFGIEFSKFNGGQYLRSVSCDSTIRLWDVEASKLCHVFNGHKGGVQCVDFSPLRSSKNSNKDNTIGLTGGNGYTICSGSWDKTIQIWDIEAKKQLIAFEGHEAWMELLVMQIQYCLDQKITVFACEIFDPVNKFKYSMGTQAIVNLVVSSNVICSGSFDNTIRFWDIRSNKSELHLIEGCDDDSGIMCLKFFAIEKERQK
ncbi:hypothetical protein RFI_21301 [Reticulomyxa filosa]|uniref:Uncharacterized protein n=1 Tax=Reticulomyxa filosa TaxID=46433 RepID=X6MSH3_RETFI|nr:hypothetical protein RFI_21301 [Reticulomyxa filosa]|eukprot:ETO16060.1 hypothetical protein RFI_21301 [Reticulomyxa filosa]